MVIVGIGEHVVVVEDMHIEIVQQIQIELFCIIDGIADLAVGISGFEHDDVVFSRGIADGVGIVIVGVVGVHIGHFSVGEPYSGQSTVSVRLPRPSRASAFHP